MKKYNFQWSSLLFFLIVLTPSFALREGFYRRSCSDAESIVQHIVQQRFRKEKSITAALLRMHYHDCFITGCDASLLIDSTASNKAEKDAAANLSVREFSLIDQIKSALEARCPGTVSCADIIALATRDSVALAGGPNYNIPTGRRDGLVSRVDEVNMPGPTSSVSQAKQAFGAKGLTLKDMVVLLGGHTVGVAHCSFFRDRLFNFQGTGDHDPSMDQAFVNKMSNICGTNANIDPTVFLDQNTSFTVDHQYYKEIMNRKGVLKFDQALAEDKQSANIVTKLAEDNILFRRDFAKALIKLGKVQVLEGNEGEVRTNCRVFNQ